MGSDDIPVDMTPLETLQALADEIRRLVDLYPENVVEIEALGDAIEEMAPSADATENRKPSDE